MSLLRKKSKNEMQKKRLPRTVQDVIPVKTVYDDGIFQIGRNQYSRTYRFSDINYAVASYEDKIDMLKEYMSLINSLEPGAMTKITINNRRLNRADFERDILLKEKEDELNCYRREYNQILLDKATGGNVIVQEKYFTITITADSLEDAKLTFERIGNGLTTGLERLGSNCVALKGDERLRIFHDFYRYGEEIYYQFDFDDNRKRGHSFKDYICPDYVEVKPDYLKLGERYARVLFFKEYASYITDDIVAKLTDRKKNMMFSIDVTPVSTGEAIRDVEKRLLGVDTNITQWQRRQNANNNFTAEIPYDMELQRKQLKEFLDDLQTRDQRMLLATITIVHTAETLQELNRDTKAILSTALENLCQIGILKYQQIDGLNTVLPAGGKHIGINRTLTTEALSAFVPFKVQEVQHKQGIYYGQNVKSHNMIIVDRRKLLNGNAFILGVSGSGKSFAAKSEITNIMLSTDADVIIIDPEREYTPLVRALGGEVVEISATSKAHINAMDMHRHYGEVNPVIEKSQFLQSLCEQIIVGNEFSKGQQSIIDRCTENVYRYYLQGDYRGTPPTLRDFREELLKQPEPEAKSLALELELFTTGSLNTFAKQTNVNTENRLLCYDILDLGEQLKTVGMLVILDSILNRVTKNRIEGKETYIYIDEIYLLYMHKYSEQFLYKMWKRVRKYGGYLTGITQDVEDPLRSHTARSMLSNSEFIIILNQAAINREELATLLNISDNQLSYITNVEAGKGLLKVGNTLVPFENNFPKETELYRLMTTKPGEHDGDKDKRNKIKGTKDCKAKGNAATC